MLSIKGDTEKLDFSNTRIETLDGVSAQDFHFEG